MATSHPIPRRWFRISLRTLFVVVMAVAFWLAQERKFVSERKAFLEQMRDKAMILYAEEGATGTLLVPGQTTVPFWRSWMGDRTVAKIISLEPLLSSEWSEERDVALREEIHRLFPESEEYAPIQRTKP